MNFTREPIIETVVTPKEGYKLVVRNSKGGGAEEFFVDAVEVITFGGSCFFRSLEKPKSFLVPVNDYEILEVREARMVLKSAGVERVKIAGGREAPVKATKETEEQKTEKRRERRRTRKKKGKEVGEEEEAPKEEKVAPEKRPSLIPPPDTLIHERKGEEASPLIPPPVPPVEEAAVTPEEDG